MDKRKETVEKLARKIKLIILDVDGVLTDNGLYIDDNGVESKKFSIADGMGIWMAHHAGIEIALISGRPSKTTAFRAFQLKIKHIYLGSSDKLEAYDKLKHKLNITDDQIAYMGDDLPDIPVLKQVGFPICVKNAQPLVKRVAKLVTKTKGGEGAVREVMDLILKAKQKDPLEWI